MTRRHYINFITVEDAKRLEKQGRTSWKQVSRGQITKDWLPVPEAAARLGVSTRQVYSLIRAKKIRAAAIIWPSGYHVWWITRASVDRYGQERYTK